MIGIEEALLRVGEELKKAMTQQLKDNKSYGTGQLANSIEYSVQQKGFEFQLIRKMLEYGNYVDQGIGRGPGKPAPVQEIMEWLQLKRINIPAGLTMESFAFAIANKIGRVGTNPKPRPFISPSLQKVLRTTGKDILTEAGIQQLQANIENQLQDIKVKA